MSLSIKVRRPERQQHSSIHSYLKEKSEGDPKLCHAILTEGSNQPWLTLVLGSGCTQSKDDNEALLATAGRIGAMVETGLCVDGQPLGDLVHLHAQDLIRDRLRLSDRPTTDPAAQAPDPQPWIPNLFVATALLTKLYFEIKARNCDSLYRTDHDDEVVLPRTWRSWRRLREELVKPCQDAIASLGMALARGDVTFADEGAQDPNLGLTIEKLLQHLASGLSESQVRLSLVDIEALTEFAWFCLGAAAKANVYLGWSDLLLTLSQYDEPSRGKSGTPAFNELTSAQKFIKQHNRKVTNKNWNRSSSPPFYVAAARLLNAEASYRVGFNPAIRPPGATVFVTSFDLELEMALLREQQLRKREGEPVRPFVIAMPVYVVNKDAKLAHTCWVSLRVDGSRSSLKESLLEPQAENWRVLEEDCAEDGPVIVRLAGCPLIPLPRLDDNDCAALKAELVKMFRTTLRREADGSEERLAYVVDNLQLQHAVVISEYDALLQSSVDLMPAPEARFGLPAAFVGGKEVPEKDQGWSRFWLMFGVQVGDSAVRNRIATLVATLPVTEGKLGGRYGLAVNLHSTELEQDLLFWNGFDVVAACVTEFEDELRHCTEHLVRGTPFLGGGGCDV